MSSLVDANTAKLAGLLSDLLQKYRQGQITSRQLDWFINMPKLTREDILRVDRCTRLWKSFQINKPLKSLEEVRDYLKRWGGITVSDTADDFLAEVFEKKVPSIGKTVSLFRVTKEDVGYEIDINTLEDLDDFLNHVRSVYGLKACPYIAGPVLRAIYANQPENERIVLPLEQCWRNKDVMYFVERVGEEKTPWLSVFPDKHALHHIQGSDGKDIYWVFTK